MKKLLSFKIASGWNHLLTWSLFFVFNLDFFSPWNIVFVDSEYLVDIIWLRHFLYLSL